RYVSVETMEEMERQGRVLERRDYETVNGQWSYFTADDGQFAEDAGDTLLIGTPEVYRGLVKTLGADRIVPVLVEVDDEERLFRSIWREKKQTVPNYAEVCRRFLADEKDYAPEVLEELFGMRLNRIYNWSFEACLIQARELLSGILGK
ncbi:MAG: guanylate kinase, partial [Lachnospiraceae bacterium]|nr:guanylate kinase [Lachnospiraceae bacterium]